jgi:hypothetical protein
LGIYEFILGDTNAGLNLLLVSTPTCGIGRIPVTVIGLVEGVMFPFGSDA